MSNSSIGKTIARNATILMGAQVITWISSFVLLYFLPRYLGSEDFGRLYLALSIKMILGLLIDFGGNYLIPKEVARSEKKGVSVMSSYLILRVILWVLAIGLILLFSDLIGYSEHVNLLILVLAVAKLWEGGSSALHSYFQGIERMEYPSIGKIAEKVFVSLIAVIALLLGADSMGVAIIITVGALLNLLIMVWYSRRFVKIKYEVDTRVFKLLGTGMPYFLFGLFSVIYYRIDAMMISAITTEEVTGWYGGAYKFFDIVMVLPLIYMTVIFPVFSKLWDDKEGRLENTVGESLRLMVILGVPAAIVIFLYAAPIIDFFMGLDEYGPAVIVLQLFAISIPVIYIDIVLGSAILGAANRQKMWAVVGLMAIFVNVGVNYFLIPHTQAIYSNGGIGAALATLATELFVMACAISLLPKSYFATFRPSYLIKPVGSGLLMLVSFLVLNALGLNWILSILAGSLIYLGGLFLLKAFTKAERDLIRSYMTADQIKFILNPRDSTS